jgi:hypothetical protein
MRRSLFSFIVFSCVISLFSVSFVFAQLPTFYPYFDRKFYELGSTGIVMFDVQTYDVAFDISKVGVTLYLPKTDGTTFETEFFGENYGENPLQIPADTQISLPFNFKIPDRTDLKSGSFSYLFEIYIRPQNTTTYSHETYGPEEAKAYGEECILYVPQSIPSPIPTNEPTPTPVPMTSPPTPTPVLTPAPTEGYDQPADTIRLTATEIALIVVTIIAVGLGAIAVWALKRK